jgi:hypothetical protein
MDGGTFVNANLNAAVDLCREIVDDESKITVDIMICGDPQPAKPEDKD